MRVRLLSGQRLGKILSLIAGAGVTMLVQVAAILSLEPAAYGRFSLFYICFGLGGSAILSLVCEPWVMSEPEDVDQYFSALALVALVLFLLVTGVGALVGEIGGGIIAAIAIAASLFRQGARYNAIVLGDSRTIVRPDLVAMAIFFIGMLAGVLGGVKGDWLVLVPWAFSSVVSVLMSRGWRVANPAHVAWFRERWRVIRYLVVDSTLLEIGTTGTSAILAPSMGVSDFGVYRSISSAAAPVRLVLTPARPYIARMDRARARSVKLLVAVSLAGVFCGLLVYVGLLLVGRISSLQESAVMGLVKYRLAAATFVLGNVVSTFYYFVLRSVVGGRALLRYRLVMMIISLGFPLAGWGLNGLGGAVWGFAAVNCVAIFISWLPTTRALAD